MIECQQLSKNYQNGKNPIPVLKNINLQINAGEFIAILGPSGSGKTTLLSILGGLDVATEGTCLIDGENTQQLSTYQLAQLRNHKIGFIFQSFHLLPYLNMLDNVALPLVYRNLNLEIRHQLAQEMLTKVGLSDKYSSKPAELSGGQKQRAAIARALVTKPKIILADEATGNLDSENGLKIIHLFRQLAMEGTTVIMVTHDEKLAEFSDKIFHVKDGMIN